MASDSMREHKDSIREQHVGKFELISVSDRHVIAYDGEPYIIMLKDERLPLGFNERAIRMICDMMVGRRTELWEAQSLYGDNISPTRSEIMARRDTSVVEENDQDRR